MNKAIITTTGNTFDTLLAIQNFKKFSLVSVLMLQDLWDYIVLLVKTQKFELSSKQNDVKIWNKLAT